MGLVPSLHSISALGEPPGDVLGDTLGAWLAAVGDALGVSLGDKVCGLLGDALGDTLGDALGEADGAPVGGQPPNDDQTYGHAVLAPSESSIRRLLQSLKSWPPPNAKIAFMYVTLLTSKSSGWSKAVACSIA